MTLEAEGRRFGDLVITGGTMSFQNDSLWYHQLTWNSVNRYDYIHNDTHILIYVCANML